MSFERMGRDKRFGCETHRGFRASSVVYTKIKHWKFVRRIALLAVALAPVFAGSTAFASSAEARGGVYQVGPVQNAGGVQARRFDPRYPRQVSFQRREHQS